MEEDPGGGFEVDFGTVKDLARKCYDIAEQYSTIMRKIPLTDDARPHLADQNGEATAGDVDVIAMLDEFYEYLTTTTARYYLAAEKVEDSAKAYAEQEDESAGSWTGIGDYELGWDPSALVDDTSRPEGTTEYAPGYGTDTHAAPEDEEGKADLEGLDGGPDGEN